MARVRLVRASGSISSTNAPITFTLCCRCHPSETRYVPDVATSPVSVNAPCYSGALQMQTTYLLTYSVHINTLDLRSRGRGFDSRSNGND